MLVLFICFVQEYELLSILDFNNVRKRMSVILRRNNKIVLYCKGADNVIYDRLSSNQGDLKSRTQDHLNVKIETIFQHNSGDCPKLITLQ